MMSNLAVVEFESPSPHRPKPVPVAGFTKDKNQIARTLPRFINYRLPRLVKSSHGWYIEYWYRIPVHLRPEFGGKEWYRFRDRDDMNRRRGEDREQYADWLLTHIADQLRGGYDPFAMDKEKAEEVAILLPEQMSAADALSLFLEKWKLRGLDPLSYAKYERYVTRLMEWLHQKRMLKADVSKIGVPHIEEFLTDMKKKYSYSNRESNNCHDFIRTAFNFLIKKKIIEENPCAGIDKLKAKSGKHRFYDKENLTTITRLLLARDPYAYLAFQTVYYLCVRSDKELMNLKVGNIQWEENKVLTESSGSKGGAGRYIPMDENIKRLFLEHGINNYPPDYYVFGVEGKPSPKPFSHGFFTRRFRKIRDAAGLPAWFTPYGAKHTRIIHLKSDGVSDANIMALTGHKDFTSYAKYLRDLGMTVNIKDLNEKSRVI